MSTTGKDGIARIKKVVPGDRKVKIDMRKMPLDLTIRGVTVKEVKVEPRRTVTVEFGLVKTGVIKGVVYADLNDNDAYDFVEDRGLPNIRVYLMPGEKDTLTLTNGVFYMDSVYPGEYDVCVDLETVPREYTLSTPDKVHVKVEELKKLEGLSFGFKPKAIDIDYFVGDESKEENR
jgi:hypothetical protein